MIALKKSISIILVCLLPLFLFSCGKRSGGIPIIQTSFNQRAVVTLGTDSYPCQISRTDTADLVIKMLKGAPTKGLVYAASADNIMITLDNMTFTLTPQEVREHALIFTLSSLFNAMTRTTELSVEKVKDGFSYAGTCKAGAFTVVQNSDYTYRTIDVGQYHIQF